LPWAGLAWSGAEEVAVARDELPLVIAVGFVVDHSERAEFGWIERLVATKPKV